MDASVFVRVNLMLESSGISTLVMVGCREVAMGVAAAAVAPLSRPRGFCHVPSAPNRLVRLIGFIIGNL